MFAGPDTSRFIEEFASILDKQNSIQTKAHQETHSLQVKYRTGVLSFVDVIEQLGNPFLPCQELVALIYKQ